LGLFRGGVDSKTISASSERLLLGEYASQDAEVLGRLNGLASVAEANKKYGDAQLADMAAARRVQLLNTVVGLGTGVPLPALKGKAQTALNWLKFSASQGSNHAGGLFDTGNGAEAGYANERNYDERLAQARLPAAQAILDLARLNPDKLPQDVAWPKDEKDREEAQRHARSVIREARVAADSYPFTRPDHGRISLESPSDVTKFTHWFAHNKSIVMDAYLKNTNAFDDETQADRNTWFK
jgi:hypothetical protein